MALTEISRNCRSSAKNFKSEPRHLLPALSKAFSLWQRLCTMTYQDYQDTCDQGEVGCTDALGTRTSPRGRRCSAGGGPGRARISLACTGNDWDTENVRKPQLKHSPNTAGTRTRQGHGHEGVSTARPSEYGSHKESQIFPERNPWHSGNLWCFDVLSLCSPRFIDTAEARHCNAEANQWKELLQATKHGTIQRIKIMYSCVMLCTTLYSIVQRMFLVQ